MFANSDGSALTFTASSEVKLRNEDTYRCVCVMELVILQEIEYSVHYRITLIYSMSKAFLQQTMEELVSKFNKKSTASV